MHLCELVLLCWLLRTYAPSLFYVFSLALRTLLLVACLLVYFIFSSFETKINEIKI